MLKQLDDVPGPADWRRLGLNDVQALVGDVQALVGGHQSRVFSGRLGQRRVVPS
jgi:hypothetical protein